MQVKRMIAVAAAIVASTGALADSTSSEGPSLEDCFKRSRPVVQQCAEKAMNESARGLKDAEEAAIGALNKWPDDTVWATTVRTRLTAIFETFGPYRDALCSGVAVVGGQENSSTPNMHTLSCIVGLNANQVFLYSAYAEARPPKPGK